MSKVLIGNVKGPTGAPGASISVTSVAESAVDGAANVVTFSDGKTLSVRNGSKGSNGKSAYQYAQEAGYSGTESEFAHKLAQNDSDAEQLLTDNLFDKTAAQSGKVFYYSASGLSLANAEYSYYLYVPLRGAGTYRTKWDNSQHSSTGARVGITKADNTWLQTITGTLTATGNNYAYDMEFVITQEMINSGAAKIAFDCHSTMLGSVMIVKDRAYPDTYIPYGYLNNGDAGNVLQGKTAVFLGDSICAGSTVSGAYHKYGWAGLIGEANGMTWENYGKDGGTVTNLSEVSSGLWLSAQADLSIAQYPNADYVIFEGGCNDADRMKDDGLGVISSNYATFDTSTFSGAFEALVLKLVNAYPNAKIGYVIPQKMYAQNDHSAAGHVHRRFFDRAVEICQKWGIPVIDLWKASNLNPKLSNASQFYTDGQHLTLEGYRKITPMIEAWMCDLYGSGGTGTKGDKGDTGATGATGPQGPKGDTGATGPQGPKGDKGDTGATGSKGEKGDKGDKGDTGSQGPKGDTGAQGAKGDKGDPGEKGDTGLKGDTGKTAYQYAVDGGYTGTEAEFAAKMAEESVSSWNDLTNKPEGVGYAQKTVLMPETTLTFVENGFMFDPPTFIYEAGETYEVTWNGVVYTCQAVNAEGFIWIGNSLYSTGGEDTGEPFMSYYHNGEEGTHTVIYSADGNPAAVKITHIGVHKIEPKYLGICRKTTGLAIPETTYNVPNDGGNTYFGGLDLEPDFPIEEGNTYKVTYNGNSYSCVAVPAIISGLVALVNEDVTEFKLYVGQGKVLIMTEGIPTVTFKVETDQAYKIAPKFLPDGIGGGEPELLGEIVMSQGNLERVDTPDGPYYSFNGELEAEVTSLLERVRNMNKPIMVVMHLVDMTICMNCVYMSPSAALSIAESLSWSYVVYPPTNDVANVAMLPHRLVFSANSNVEEVVSYGMPVTMQFYA